MDLLCRKHAASERVEGDMNDERMPYMDVE